MKTTTILAVAAFSVALGPSFAATAATEAPAIEQAGSAVQAPPQNTRTTAPRHSHTGEKVGVSAEQLAASDAHAGKTSDAKPATSRHNHQRDMK